MIGRFSKIGQIIAIILGILLLASCGRFAPVQPLPQKGVIQYRHDIVFKLNGLLHQADVVAKTIYPGPSGSDNKCGTQTKQYTYIFGIEDHADNYFDLTIFDGSGVKPGLGHDKAYKMRFYKLNSVGKEVVVDDWMFVMRQTEQDPKSKLFQATWRFKLKAKYEPDEEIGNGSNMHPKPGEAPWERPFPKGQIKGRFVIVPLNHTATNDVDISITFDLKVNDINTCFHAPS